MAKQMGCLKSNFEAAFFVCAMHGDKLDGASPLWGFVIANH